MAPKTLSAEEKEREKEKEKQKRFNRQINFYYMRHMWQLVCGRSKWNDDDTIYNALNIRRERYTRVIDSGIIRYGKGELDNLVETTGLPKEIFTGETRFACKYYSTEEGTIQSIIDEEWENLFTWRNERQQLRVKMKHPEEYGIEEDGVRKLNLKYKKIIKRTQPKDDIHRLLKKVGNAKRANDDFRCLHYFMKKREPVPASGPSINELITRLEESVNVFGFDKLDSCSTGDLDKIKEILTHKLKLVNNILVYKEEKEKAEQK